MMNDRTSDRSRIAYSSLCVFASLFVIALFLWKPGVNSYNHAYVSDMVYGRAARPFMYRTLLPTTTRLIVAAIPSGARQYLEESWGRTASAETLFRLLDWDNDYFVEHIVAAVLMYASLCGFIIAARRFFDTVYAAPRVVQEAFTIVTLLGLTQCFRYTNYLYDLPALFLFTLGLVLMARRRWGPYLVVFALACLNKETTILLTMVFVMHFWNAVRRPSRFVVLVVAQIVLFAAIKIGLTFAYRDNPGAFVEYHFSDHNLDVLRAYSLPTVLAGAGLVLFLFFDWRAKPQFLRNAVWIVVPLFVLAVFIGYLDELRIFYEVYPVIMLLLVQSVSRVWKFELRSQPESADAS